MARTLATATRAQRKATAERAKRTKNPNDKGYEEETSEAADDIQLLRALRKLGATVGPINDSTRALYQRRLDKLLKQRGVNCLDQISENEEEETLILKTKNASRGRRRGNTEDNEEEEKEEENRKKANKNSIGINKEDQKAPIEKPKNKRNVRRTTMIVEDQSEVEERTPIVKQVEEVAKVRSQRKKKDKKVSFARFATGDTEYSDEDAGKEEDETPVKLVMKKREPSVDIIAVVKEKNDKKRERPGSTVDEKPKMNETIVIEEEEEESEEEMETRTVSDSEVEEEGGMKDESSLHSPRVIPRRSWRIERSDDEEEEEEEDNDIEEENEANSTLDSVEEEKKEEDIDDILNDREKEDTIEIADEEESEREECSTPHRPMNIRHVFTVDTPKETRVRRSEVDRSMGMEEENEVDERKTMNIFNSTPRSHRSTMHIFRDRMSRVRTGNYVHHMPQVPPPRNITKILEESDSMDISNGSEDGTSNANALRNEKSNWERNDVEGEDDESILLGKTFVVRKRTSKTPPRVTRNIFRSPSRSPSRNRRGTYLIPQSSSSLIPPKSVLLPSPSRSRAPPKPMPRRFIGTTLSSIEASSSSLMTQPTCKSVVPPVPAPRRIVRDTKGEETRKSRLGMNGTKKNVDMDGEKEEISPASRFLTQPRPMRVEKKEVFTPVDRENIEKLRSLRASMREMRQGGLPTGKIELEARMIVEESPHLKNFFY